MGKQYRYVTLVSSLPAHLPSLFAAKQTPISRIGLNRRLTMLTPEDSHELKLIEEVMQWSRIHTNLSDADLIRRADRVMKEVNSDLLRQIVLWRLELRTVVSALRHKYRGLALPSEDAAWGYGRWQRLIRRHWNEPDLGMQRIFPWVAEADHLMAEKNTFDLERLVLRQVWDYYGHIVSGHYFDFEAVVVYVLRWNVIDRWARYNSKDAGERFDRLVARALGGYTELYEPAA
ncbi:MAG: hypothetical protein ABFS02_12705 [Pseudomonadota bacterium]